MATTRKNPMKSYIKGVGQETYDSPYNYPYYYGNGNQPGRPNPIKTNGLLSFDTGYGFDTTLSPTDSMYNLGSLIGTAWGINYNQRGVNKRTDEAMAMLNRYKQAAEASQPSQQLEANFRNISAPSTEERAAASVGIKQVPYDPQASDIGKGMEHFDASGNFRTNKPQTFEPQPFDLQREKAIMLKNKWDAAAASGTDNPNNDKRDAQAKAKEAMQAIQTIPLESFDANAFRSEIVAMAKKKGSNEYQIQEMTKMLEPQIQAMDKQRKELVNTQLQKKYDEAYQKGDFNGMYQANVDLLKNDPVAAQRNQFTLDVARADQLEDHKIARRVEQIKKADPTLSDTEAYKLAVLGSGALTSGLRSAGAGGGTTVKNEFAYTKGYPMGTAYIQGNSAFAEDGTWLGYTPQAKQEARDTLKELGYKGGTNLKEWAPIDATRIMNAQLVLAGSRPAGISWNTGKAWDMTGNYNDMYSTIQRGVEDAIASGKTADDGIREAINSINKRGGSDMLEQVVADFKGTDYYKANKGKATTKGTGAKTPAAPSGNLLNPTQEMIDRYAADIAYRQELRDNGITLDNNGEPSLSWIESVTDTKEKADKRNALIAAIKKKHGR